MTMCLSVYLTLQRAHNRQNSVLPNTLLLTPLSHPTPFGSNQPSGKLIFVGLPFKGISQFYHHHLTSEITGELSQRGLDLFIFK